MHATMDGLVILVAGLFLDFAAALILLIPLPKLSRVSGLISTLQQGVVANDASGQSEDFAFYVQEDRPFLDKLSADMTKHERHLFPYGIAFLAAGFAFVVVGVLIGS